MSTCQQAFRATRRFSLVLSCLVLGSMAPGAPAQDAVKETETVRPELASAIGTLSDRLSKRLPSNERLMIGPIAGPNAPAVIKALKDALRNVPQVAVRQGTAWQLSGEIQSGFDVRTQLFVTAIKTRLVDSDLRPRDLSVLKITGEEDAFAIGAPGNFDLSRKLSETSPASPIPAADRAKVIEDALQHPGFAIAGSVVRASKDSPFGIEILSARPGEPFTPCVVRDDGGMPRVQIPPGHMYAVRIVNDASFDAGVMLNIDGINSLEFSSRFRPIGRWVVDRQSTGTIKGWQRDGQQAAAFLVGDYGASPAAVYGQPNKAGFIQASFSFAYRKGEPIPRDEQDAANNNARGKFATLLGPPIQQNVTEVERQFGVVRANIAIGYTEDDLSDLPAAK